MACLWRVASVPSSAERCEPARHTADGATSVARGEDRPAGAQVVVAPGSRHVRGCAGGAPEEVSAPLRPVAVHRRLGQGAPRRPQAPAGGDLGVEVDVVEALEGDCRLAGRRQVGGVEVTTGRCVALAVRAVQVRIRLALAGGQGGGRGAAYAAAGLAPLELARDAADAVEHPGLL